MSAPTHPTDDAHPDERSLSELDRDFLARWNAAGERTAWNIWQFATPHQRQLITDHEAKRAENHS